jgi:hypothetical protein
MPGRRRILAFLGSAIYCLDVGSERPTTSKSTPRSTSTKAVTVFENLAGNPSLLEEPRMPSSSFYSRIGRLSSIIFVLPSCMAVGGLLGYYVVDRYLGSYPWGTVVFVLLGAVAGFYEIVRILMLDQRNKD